LPFPTLAPIVVAKETTVMMFEFTVGLNIAGKPQSVTVTAEDALIAALKVKHERPDAVINYVRRRNRRGDLRHPHGPVVAKPEGTP
jgi:hypothetical protein